MSESKEEREARRASMERPTPTGEEGLVSRVCEECGKTVQVVEDLPFRVCSECFAAAQGEESEGDIPMATTTEMGSEEPQGWCPECKAHQPFKMTNFMGSTLPVAACAVCQTPITDVTYPREPAEDSPCGAELRSRRGPLWGTLYATCPMPRGHEGRHDDGKGEVWEGSSSGVTLCGERDGGDQRILAELRGHLERAREWAHPDDIGAPGYDGWTCVKSTLDAVEAGDLCLALTRWDDLSPRGRPELSEEGRAWRSPTQRPGWPPGFGRGGGSPPGALPEHGVSLSVQGGGKPRILYTGGWEAGAREVCRQVWLGNGGNPEVVHLAKAVEARRKDEGSSPGVTAKTGSGDPMTLAERREHIAEMRLHCDGTYENFPSGDDTDLLCDIAEQALAAAGEGAQVHYESLLDVPLPEDEEDEEEPAEIDEATRDALEELHAHLVYLQGECVDDPEETMTELACEDKFTAALEVVLSGSAEMATYSDGMVKGAELAGKMAVAMRPGRLAEALEKVRESVTAPGVRNDAWLQLRIQEISRICEAEPGFYLESAERLREQWGSAEPGSGEAEALLAGPPRNPLDLIQSMTPERRAKLREEWDALERGEDSKVVKVPTAYTAEFASTVDRAAASYAMELDAEDAGDSDPTCCFQGCGQPATRTAQHDSHTYTCDDHLEALRPWVEEGSLGAENVVGAQVPGTPPKHWPTPKGVHILLEKATEAQLCGGCNVREPWEHRCHGWRACGCAECWCKCGEARPCAEHDAEEMADAKTPGWGRCGGTTNPPAGCGKAVHLPPGAPPEDKGFYLCAACREAHGISVTQSRTERADVEPHDDDRGDPCGDCGGAGVTDYHHPGKVAGKCVRCGGSGKEPPPLTKDRHSGTCSPFLTQTTCRVCLEQIKFIVGVAGLADVGLAGVRSMADRPTQTEPPGRGGSLPGTTPAEVAASVLVEARARERDAEEALRDAVIAPAPMPPSKGVQIMLENMGAPDWVEVHAPGCPNRGCVDCRDAPLDPRRCVDHLDCCYAASVVVCAVAGCLASWGGAEGPPANWGCAADSTWWCPKHPMPGAAPDGLWCETHGGPPSECPVGTGPCIIAHPGHVEAAEAAARENEQRRKTQAARRKLEEAKGRVYGAVNVGLELKRARAALERLEDVDLGEEGREALYSLRAQIEGLMLRPEPEPPIDPRFKTVPHTYQNEVCTRCEKVQGEDGTLEYCYTTFTAEEAP